MAGVLWCFWLSGLVRRERSFHCLFSGFVLRALATGMLPLSERPLPSDVAVPKAVIFRQQMEQREKVRDKAKPPEFPRGVGAVLCPEDRPRQMIDVRYIHRERNSVFLGSLHFLLHCAPTS